MNKTMQAIIADIERQGFAVKVGKRAFNCVEALRTQGYRVMVDVFNANGPEFRSQWNSPRSKTVYEISVYPKMQGGAA